MASAATRLPHAQPEQAGMRAEKLAEIDGAIDEALVNKQMPGCVVLIARQGKIVLLKAYGQRSLEPAETPMTCDTVFDLASLTKPIATATSVMLLVEQGRLTLDEPAAKYLPEFGQKGKAAITVRQLLTHRSGLIADNPIEDFAAGPDQAIQKIFAAKPPHEPASTFVYADVGFIVLGELVRRVSGEGVHQFMAQRVFGPLGMSETGYLPPEELRGRAAPTERRNDRWIQGEVHDPRAYALGGVAGHAGLFSTAEDLAIYAQMLLGRGEYAGVCVLAPETVDTMLTAQTVPGGGLRTLGWDMKTGYSSNRGEGFSARAVGHGGFTGTALWIDPELELTVIFLSNRVHPDGKGNVNRLAGRIGTLAAEAILHKP
ncbi:MAG TPA: serine hydrolase domain-containing protein [Pirellulales bacterium]|nr:serine hydrolase domain-containing protein [Pirellulales bacterium]